MTVIKGQTKHPAEAGTRPSQSSAGHSTVVCERFPTVLVAYNNPGDGAPVNRRAYMLTNGRARRISSETPQR